jgi:hypothetical protein
LPSLYYFAGSFFLPIAPCVASQHYKGQFALADVVKVVDPGNNDSQQSRAFMIGVTKRTYTFIADSIELKECWMQIFRCILGQG